MQICIALLALIILVEVEGELCNNGCLQNATDNWCNKRRTTGDGSVARCAEKTRYGYDCASSCRKGSEKYYWCWESWNLSENWEYCGLPGLTRYGVKCVGDCVQEGKDYWWCYTEYDRRDSSKGTKWEYCSPPAQVKKVTNTIHGLECLGDCDRHGEDYWWCVKSQRWKGNGGRGSASDQYWDYCSPQKSPHKARTRYNKACNGACASRGEEYFWCNDWDGSWEYCSPRVEEKPVYAKEGQPCAGSCDKREKSYKYCPVVSVAEFSIKKRVSYYWDYCGTTRKDRVSSSSLVQIGYLALTFGLLSTGINSF